MSPRGRKIFGQLIIGAPGAGKSTYCQAMHQLLVDRRVIRINLDPANNPTSTVDYDIDISRLVRVDDVMNRLNLGPNGALIYCMQLIAANMWWLQTQLDQCIGDDGIAYLLYDMPGQIELYTHDESVRHIVDELQTRQQLVSVHLSDALYCREPGNYISVLLTSLASMIRLEMPHINVLSKVDLIDKYGGLPFSLDFFTQVPDTQQLLQLLDHDGILQKYEKLNSVLCDVVTDYSLVNFLPLDINDKDSMMRVLKAADQANGFYFSGGVETKEDTRHQMLSA